MERGKRGFQPEPVFRRVHLLRSLLSRCYADLLILSNE